MYMQRKEKQKQRKRKVCSVQNDERNIFALSQKAQKQWGNKKADNGISRKTRKIFKYLWK